MDPNLVKMKDVFMDDVAHGREPSMGKTIGHASSYLTHIHGENFYKVERELSQFKDVLFKLMKGMNNGQQ